MKRLMIPAFALVVLAAAAIVLRSSPSIDIAVGAAAMPPLHELHAGVGVSTLPVMEIEDQSLVFTTTTKP
jgi:hypothetical protein